MREQEIADEEAAKKKKEWEKEWEVSSFEERLNISIELVLGAFSSGGVVKRKDPRIWGHIKIQCMRNPRGGTPT